MPAKHDALPLRTVSRLTGLTPDLIRAWERRYRVVTPRRGPRGARLYGSADVARLALLRRVVDTGRAIGDVARLGMTELEALAAEVPAGRVSRAGAATESAVESICAAVDRFDERAVSRLLSDALLALGTREFIGAVAVPLLDEVGRRWSDGRLGIAGEHLVSALLRSMVNSVIRTRGDAGGPTVVLATPAGERHELGLLLAGLLVADAGAHLCYLGADLPAAEIADAARRVRARVVGVGLVYRRNVQTAVAEVRHLQRALPRDIEMWLGGAAAPAVAARLAGGRALVLDDMPAVERELARIRREPPHA